MAQPVPPSALKRRPWRRVVIAMALLLVATLAGVVLLRDTLATRLALALLQDEGIPVQNLEVTGLTPGAVSLAALLFGENGEVAAESLNLRLTWDGLFPQAEEITLDGLQVKLDLTGEGPLLGSLQPLVERYTATGPATETASPETAAAPLPPLPRVTLRRAVVTAATPSGPMTGSLSAGLAPQDDGSLKATATLELDNALGRLKATLEGAHQPDGNWQVEGEISEGRLAWQQLSVGGFDGGLQVTYRPLQGPKVTAGFDLAELAFTPAEGPPLRLAEGRLNLSSDEYNSASLTVSAEGEGERLSLSGQARAHPAGESLDIDVSLRGEAATAGGLAQALPALAPGLQIEAGQAVIEAEGTGYLLNGGRVPGAWQDFLAALPQSRLAMTGEVVLAQLRLADGSSGLSGHLPLAFEAFQDDLTVTLTQDAELRVERPSRQALQDLGVPADLLPLVASGLSLTLAAEGDLPFKSVSTPLWPPREAALAFTATGRSDQGLRLAAQVEGEARLDEALALAAFSGEVAGRLELAQVAFGGREAQGVALDLPLATRYGPEGLSLALTRPGSLKIRQFGKEAPLRLEAPLAFSVKALSLQAAPDGATYGYSLEAAEDGARLAISRAGTGPLDLAAGALDLKLAGRFARDQGHDARLDLWLQGFDLPGYEVAAGSAEVSIDLDSELRPESSRFTLGPVALTGAAPPLAPLTLAGQLQRRGAGYDITGVLGLSGGRALADLTARYEDTGRASVEAVSRLIAFSPEGLQPADISPLLADLEEVSGSLTGRANFAWPPDPRAESGRVTLDGFSFKTAAGEVRGLDLDLRLVSLLPLASAAGQKLSIAALDAAVPVDTIEVIFALDQAPRPQLAIARGGFGLGGARWQVEPLVVDPAEPRHRVVLGTEDLDLATFFELIEVDGLSGRGALQGRLPIVFAGEDVIVENGHFEAKAPGVLNIRIDALRAALSGSGETVEMAARALEDFRFETLSLEIAKTAANDATLRLSTLGHNPAVLDGQPFQFNINLESNLTSVLEALKQGYSLSDEALERAWRLRE